MADSTSLPGPRVPLVDQGGLATMAWFQFFRGLSVAPASINPDLSGFLPSSTQVAQGAGVRIFGTLAEGRVEVSLDTLTPLVGGTFQLITRDEFGRISDIDAGDATDVPADDTAWTVIAGANVQAALDATDAALADLAPLDSPTLTTPSLAGLTDAVDDAAAATAGVPVGGVYRNGSVLQIRVT